MKPLHSLVTLCLSLGLVACGGGYEGSPSPTDTSGNALKVEGSTAVVLAPTELKRLEVSGGTRPYSAASSNTTVALAFANDGLLTVAAVRGDTTPITVTVTDAKGAKAAVNVTVTNSPQQGTFSLSSEQVSVRPGATVDVRITGGTPPFSATSLSSHIATGTISGNTLTVAGIAEGNDAEVKVFDSKSVTQTLLATVAAPLPSASGLPLTSNLPANLTLRPNNSSTYTLGGGTPPYSVVSNNTATIRPSVRGAALMLSTGVSGNGTVTVSDTVGATLTQRIFVQTTSAPLSLAQTSVTGTRLTTTDVGISGGMPPYKVLTNSTSVIANGSLIDGDVLRINMLNVGGPSLLSVSDSEGSSVSVSVSVTAVLSNLSLSPTAIAISELLTDNSPSSLPIQIVGGQAPYRVFTSHPNLLAPTVDGSTVVVRTPVTSTGAIAPCVDLNTPVAITVIDTTGATASATVTISDNGTCPQGGVTSSMSISPRAIAISELLGTNSNGVPQQTVVGAVLAGGVGPYQVYSSHPTLLTGQLNGLNLNIFTAGTAQSPIASCVNADTPVVLTVVDSLGASSTVTVTLVDQGPCPLGVNSTSVTLSPQAVTISELLSTDTNGNPQQTVITAVLAGGVGPYQVYSSNPTLLSAELTDTSLRVLSPGTSLAPTAPCVVANTPVFITVVDAQGASATITVTITDNGPCPI